ncbi:MAG: hypothetical protein IJS65_00825 [Clostridia bacterium]|nr:hypothetical protein [Clostridia bacterium]
MFDIKQKIVEDEICRRKEDAPELYASVYRKIFGKDPEPDKKPEGTPGGFDPLGGLFKNDK